MDDPNTIAEALKKEPVEHGAHAQDDGFDDKAREEIAALPEDQQADFAAVCFENPKKQRWLLAKR